MKTQRSFVFAAFFCLCAIGLASTGAAAQTSKPQENNEKAPQSDVKAAKAAPGTSADTLRMEGSDLQRMLKRDGKNLPVHRAPDGATVLHIGGGFRSVMVAQTRGTAPVVACVATEGEAVAVLVPADPQPSAPLDKKAQ
ncbi:MAG TPA: hypothetical protein VGQ46_03470 [Thermoanaerobaculia bacterium]|jgi:hypothetical protein|nr:hypothetical protein [Thermoanaerobaculia bacterium]